MTPVAFEDRMSDSDALMWSIEKDPMLRSTITTAVVLEGSVDLDRLSPAGMDAYGRACGWTLARGHARSGDRVAIAAYLGSNDAFDRALAEFAEAYADQNERDHAALVEAVKTGRVEAEEGV